MPRIIDPPYRPAYSASKPLFDALTQACTELDHEADSLKAARDQIVQMHATNAAIQETDEFKDFLNNVMDGWSWSLKTHHSIFKMVVELTDAVSEKDDSPINGPLKALLASADVAIKSTIQIRKSATFDAAFSDNDGSGECPINPVKATGFGAETESGDSESEAFSAKQSKRFPSFQKECPPKKRKLDHGVLSSVASSKSSDGEAPEEIEKTTTADKKRKAKHVSEADKFQQEEAETSFEQTDGVNGVSTQMGPPPVPARKDSTEDISAEVQARLEAKAEKKKRKQEQKKRKRDSIASSILSPSPSADLPTAKPDEVKAAQPPKKKAKFEEPKPKPNSGSDSGTIGTGKGFGEGKGPVVNSKGFGFGKGPGFDSPAGAGAKGLAGANIEKASTGTPDKKDKRKHSGEDQPGGHGGGEKHHKKKKVKTAK